VNRSSVNPLIGRFEDEGFEIEGFEIEGFEIEGSAIHDQ
jgi:hypothetical protein